MDTDVRQLIASSPLAVELDDAQRTVLSSLTGVRSLSDGEILLREGEVSSELCVVTQGRLAVTRDTGSGSWVVLHVLQPHDVAGELGFLDSLEHSATLRAVGSAQVLTLTRERLESLIATHPMIVYKVMRAVVREVHAILRRMNFQYVELTNYITKQHGRY